jgi:hypothetical protein
MMMVIGRRAAFGWWWRNLDVVGQCLEKCFPAIKKTAILSAYFFN